jgi:purine-binding chemotaxis protein CheW
MNSLDVKSPPSIADQYLTFFIAGEEYATAILKVREVVEYDTITVVPNTPSWIRGVINVRGSVLPVVDLAVKFGLPPSTISKLSCIVITEIDAGDERLTMGLLADAVSQVVDFGPDEIEQPPAFGTRVKIDYLRGMGRTGKKFCQILDIDKVLSVDELLAANDSVGAVAGPANSTESSDA